MAQAHCNASRCVTAASRPAAGAGEVDDLTMGVLQGQFDLSLDNSRYPVMNELGHDAARDIWAVLVAAAVERLTIEAACNLLEREHSAQCHRYVVG